MFDKDQAKVQTHNPKLEVKQPVVIWSGQQSNQGKQGYGQNTVKTRYGKHCENYERLGYSAQRQVH